MTTRLPKLNTLLHVSGSASAGFEVTSYSTTGNFSSVDPTAYAFPGPGEATLTANLASTSSFNPNPKSSVIGTTTIDLVGTTKNWGTSNSGAAGYIKADYVIPISYQGSSITFYAKIGGGGPAAQPGRRGGDAAAVWINTPNTQGSLWAVAGGGGGPGTNSGGAPAGYPSGGNMPCGYGGGGQNPSPGLQNGSSGPDDGSRGNYSGGGGAGYNGGSGGSDCGPIGYRSGGSGGSNGFTLGTNVSHFFPGNGQPEYTTQGRILIRLTPSPG